MKITEDSRITFVDDGSTDETWNVIQTLDVKGLKLSKNFGHQSALIAGMFENDADIFIQQEEKKYLLRVHSERKRQRDEIEGKFKYNKGRCCYL